MKTVILAAGEGTRMLPLTNSRPKGMLPLANKPILEHLLWEARKAGLTEFIFVVGFHDEQIRDYFGDGGKWGVKIDYRTQRKQLGTADAVSMVADSITGNFILINGDIIIKSPDFEAMMMADQATLGIIKVADNSGLGVVKLSRGKVVHIYEKSEKPPSDMANAGVYRFTPEIFDAIRQTVKSPRGEYEITDTLQLMIDRGYPVGYHEIDSWFNLSYPWDLLSANELLLTEGMAENLGEVENNVVMKGAVSVGEGTVVRSGSYIVGPVIIGRNCNIGPNCYIRPHTAIGDDCHIGAAVEVKNSIVMRGTKIPHHNYVGDSVIGEDCNFGAGTKIANLRLDKQAVKVTNIDTKRHKLGAIIGDRVEIGINACINVGTIIGSNTVVGPGAIASGIIPANSRLF
ncbi:bifunctional sugar-1-phosphate nucleotidylyltransferase/acetyltransferase [Chloroflexota bacterium]